MARLPASQQQAVDHIVGYLNAANGKERIPYIELLGHDTASKQLIAEKVANSLGLNLHTIDHQDLAQPNRRFRNVLPALAAGILTDAVGAVYQC